MDWGTLEKGQMGRVNLGEVLDGSGDPRGGPIRVEGSSCESWTCLGTLKKVSDGSGDPRGGPGRVGGP